MGSLDNKHTGEVVLFFKNFSNLSCFKRVIDNGRQNMNDDEFNYDEAPDSTASYDAPGSVNPTTPGYNPETPGKHILNCIWSPKLIVHFNSRTIYAGWKHLF